MKPLGNSIIFQEEGFAAPISELYPWAQYTALFLVRHIIESISAVSIYYKNMLSILTYKGALDNVSKFSLCLTP